MVSPPAPPVPFSYPQCPKKVNDVDEHPKSSQSSTSLATQALTIVAAHTASSQSPVLNVWSQRMAASRANHVSGANIGSQNNIVSSDDSMWPEVGKIKVKDEAASESPAISPRKGEHSAGKSKWVQIPRQELQDAADLHKQQQRPRRQPPSSGSRSGSAAHSRLPSASHSQSGSLQSSPLLSRGRRLPEEKEESPQPPHPYTPSPPLVVQPHLAPSPQPIPSVTYPAVAYPYPPPSHSVWYPPPPTPHWTQHHNPAYPLPHNYSPRHNNPHRPHQYTRTNLHPRPPRQPSKKDSILTNNYAAPPTNLTQPLPPALSLPVTITLSQLYHVNSRTSHLPSNPIFGTINTNSTSSRLSPSLPPNPTIADSPKPFPQFTIGVLPGEFVGTRSHFRASSNHSLWGKRSRTATSGGKGLVDLLEYHEERKEHGENNGKERLQEEKVERRDVDLTSPSELRWAIGSFGADPSTSLSSLPPLVPEVTTSSASLSASPARNTHSNSNDDPRPRELHQRLEELVLKKKWDREGEDDQNERIEEDDVNSVFQVKDYGYGFGSRASSGSSPPQPPSRQLQPQPRMDQKHGAGSGYASPVWDRDGGARFNTRESSRGSGLHTQNSSLNYSQLPHQYGQEPRRRGRGGSGIHGQSRHSPRGTHRRGRGTNYTSQPHMPPGPGMFPFDSYPGARAPMMDVNGMNSMSINGMGLYCDRLTVAGAGHGPIPNNSSTLQAAPVPVPGPVTQLPLPLYTTRWYLLGQLEYYLSAQNMAQDYFLRSRLDSKGWVPISLIASFNRVRRLTEDEVLVKEILSLSSVVETTDSGNVAMVRMKNWQAFVLPTAKASTVADLDHEGDRVGGWYEDRSKDVGAAFGRELQVLSYANENGRERLEQTGREDGVTDGEIYDIEDDEDEDDVVFVLTRDEEVTIPWSSTGEKRA